MDATTHLRDRARGALLGLACGDAVGTTLEFRKRDSYEPLDDMVGGGPFGLAPGQWTDDTSMALCLADSLLAKNGFDAHDQMQRYLDWFENGYRSSTGTCFDIGNTTRSALNWFRRTGNPLAGSDDPMSAGNGSIMRLAPQPLFYHPDRVAILRYAGPSSTTTHAAAECIEACTLMADLLCNALDGQAPDALLRPSREHAFQSPRIAGIARGEYRDKARGEIRGSGYVAESLEAALWCFHATGNFRDAILAAANLGDDADTTAAICGQIAGACYGESGIPGGWLQNLHAVDGIRELADRLLEAQPANRAR